MMTCLSLRYLDFGELNYNRKEGVIVFTSKTINPLINSIFQYKRSVISFTQTTKSGGTSNDTTDDSLLLVRW